MPYALPLALLSLAVSVVAITIAIRAYLALKEMKRSLADRLAATVPDPGPSQKMPVAGEGRAARRDRGTRRDDSHGAMNSRGPTLINVPDLSFPPSAAPAISADLANRFGAIWAMADEGVLPEAIAHKTGLPVGQVELILGLRRPRAAEPRS